MTARKMNGAQAKTNKTLGIPQDVQTPMRQRLTMLRQMHGRTKADFHCLAQGSLTTYELHDISTMRLGHIWGMANEIGISMAEMMSYLGGSIDDSLPIPEDIRLFKRMTVYMRSLPARLQAIACEQVLALVEYNHDSIGGASKASIHRSESMRRDSKAAIAERLSNRDGSITHISSS